MPNGGDGCSAACLVEEGWECAPINIDGAGPTVCNFNCITGTNAQFIDPVSGNFTVRQKPCDDGNSNNNDGCTQYCNVETGWNCTGGSATNPDTCVEICGDGWLWDTNNHECDDGNAVDGDGCSSNCTIERDYECHRVSIATPDVCTSSCPTIRVPYDIGFFGCWDRNFNPDDG